MIPDRNNYTENGNNVITGGYNMLVEVKDDKKRAEIWLTHSEADTVQAELGRIIAEYKNKNYLVTVFYSGDRELSALTGMLLKNNIA